MENIIEEYIQSPLKAIRANCLQCVGGSSNEVRLCTSKTCYLYPFRFGKNPYAKKRELTEEQRAAVSERLKHARENRSVSNIKDNAQKERPL